MALGKQQEVKTTKTQLVSTHASLSCHLSPVSLPPQGWSGLQAHTPPHCHQTKTSSR